MLSFPLSHHRSVGICFTYMTVFRANKIVLVAVENTQIESFDLCPRGTYILMFLGIHKQNMNIGLLEAEFLKIWELFLFEGHFPH